MNHRVAEQNKSSWVVLKRKSGVIPFHGDLDDLVLVPLGIW